MKYWIVKNGIERIEEVTNYEMGGRTQLIDFIKRVNNNNNVEVLGNRVYVNRKLVYYGSFSYVHHFDDNILNSCFYSLMDDSEIKNRIKK